MKVGTGLCHPPGDSFLARLALRPGWDTLSSTDGRLLVEEGMVGYLSPRLDLAPRGGILKKLVGYLGGSVQGLI